MNNLGERIKKLRKIKGFTLEELATTIGSKKSYIWEIENKGVKCPSAEKVLAIAKALDVTVEYLLGHKDLKPAVDEKQTVFFRKMGELTQDDQDKIMKIINAWSNGE